MKKMMFIVCLTLLGACQAKMPETATGVPETATHAPKNRAVSGLPANTAFPHLHIQRFDGQLFDSKNYRGKWLVVNFWATWCTPCLKEIPDFNAIAKQRSDIQVIGLAYEEIEKADMQAFLKLHSIGYPIAVLDVSNPPKDFETPRGLPMTYVIKPNGAVAKKFLGPVTAKEVLAVVDAKI